MSKLITVVMPAYNRQFYIKKAIESVLSQSYQDFDFFILNDGSTDQTEPIIQSYLYDKRITYFPFKDNRGVGKVLSFAVECIKTPYFVVVDSDDWIEPQTLEFLLDEMLKHDNVSMVYSHAKLWLDKDGLLKETGSLVHPSFDNKYDFVMYNSMPSPRFFRTDLVRKVNSFETDDPNEGRFGEDRYLLYKLIAISNFRCVDKYLYNIRIHEDNTVKKDNRKFFNESKQYVLDKLLNEWGDEYEPVYEENEAGWLSVIGLTKKDK